MLCMTIKQWLGIISFGQGEIVDTNQPFLHAFSAELLQLFHFALVLISFQLRSFFTPQFVFLIMHNDLMK